MPPVAEGREIARASSCEEAFGVILRICCDEIDRNLAVFFETDLEAGPHRTRVALRRLTSAIDAFAPILRRKITAEFRRSAKRMFRALGRVRDADVFLAKHPDREDEVLLRETQSLRLEVRKELRAQKAIIFAPSLLRAYADGSLLRQGDKGRAWRVRPVQDLAVMSLQEIWQEACNLGDDLSKLSEQDLHEFRKDMKGLRYLGEFFAPLWDPERWPAFRALMQELQNALGELNDMVNARARGRALAPEKQDAAVLRAAQAWTKMLDAGPFWQDPSDTDEGAGKPPVADQEA